MPIDIITNTSIGFLSAHVAPWQSYCKPLTLIFMKAQLSAVPVVIQGEVLIVPVPNEIVIQGITLVAEDTNLIFLK